MPDARCQMPDGRLHERAAPEWRKLTVENSLYCPESGYSGFQVVDIPDGAQDFAPST